MQHVVPELLVHLFFASKDDWRATGQEIFQAGREGVALQVQKVHARQADYWSVGGLHG